MQLLSQVTTVNVPVHPADFHPRIAEFIQRPEIKHMMWAILLVFVIGQFVNICSYWISSKALAERDKATFGMAVLLWAIYLGVAVLLPIGLLFLVPFIVMLFQNDQFRGWLVLGGTLCGTILLIFLIPMKVYVIGFIRAVAFLVLAIIIAAPIMGVVELVVARVMVAPEDLAALQAVFKPGPGATKFVQRLAGKEEPDEIDRLLDDALVPIGPKPPMAAREAQVRQLQQLLQARKASFPPGQPPPPAFQVELNRYKQLLQEVMGERSAPPAPPPGRS
ncbi:MAG TPA: hypothetical protein VGM54_22775 [Chthoniobacter sp.]